MWCGSMDVKRNGKAWRAIRAIKSKIYDESTVWVFQEEPNPTKVIRAKSALKRMVAGFFLVQMDMWGSDLGLPTLALYRAANAHGHTRDDAQDRRLKLLPPSKTNNSDLYCQQLMKLKQEKEKKKPELINRKGRLSNEFSFHVKSSLSPCAPPDRRCWTSSRDGGRHRRSRWASTECAGSQFQIPRNKEVVGGYIQCSAMGRPSGESAAARSRRRRRVVGTASADTTRPPGHRADTARTLIREQGIARDDADG
ncbi:hypothetical protein EVAR_80905_1 [Eumeta japonica]|uniref:Uncharacterized protein n=1 Tax=Eumeta variegata TaxID=151549 RepID=A0A4C1V075_EUMVA|nr:hypothetical protein EVAR_80905_1 [Eumeta japonica]